jgi:hypothetical protein
MFSKGKKVSTYQPSVAKLKGSITYWENYYKVRLKPDSEKLLLKNAESSIQNKKQISAFIHGYLRGLLVDPTKYVFRTKSDSTNFDMFESEEAITLPDKVLTDLSVKVFSSSSDPSRISFGDFLRSQKGS